MASALVKRMSNHHNRLSNYSHSSHEETLSIVYDADLMKRTFDDKPILFYLSQICDINCYFES